MNRQINNLNVLKHIILTFLHQTLWFAYFSKNISYFSIVDYRMWLKHIVETIGFQLNASPILLSKFKYSMYQDHMYSFSTYKYLICNI